MTSHPILKHYFKYELAYFVLVLIVCTTLYVLLENKQNSSELQASFLRRASVETTLEELAAFYPPHHRTYEKHPIADLPTKRDTLTTETMAAAESYVVFTERLTEFYVLLDSNDKIVGVINHDKTN
ncbi:MAG: hypothetical protein PHX74_10095 [Candidatus Sumerlaeales bacterium]|nr:hypothetical protein [Candidatus Sumerlaeales bacterium]